MTTKQDRTLTALYRVENNVDVLGKRIADMQSQVNANDTAVVGLVNKTDDALAAATQALRSITALEEELVDGVTKLDKDAEDKISALQSAVMDESKSRSDLQHRVYKLEGEATNAKARLDSLVSGQPTGRQAPTVAQIVSRLDYLTKELQDYRDRAGQGQVKHEAIRIDTKYQIETLTSKVAEMERRLNTQQGILCRITEPREIAGFPTPEKAVRSCIAIVQFKSGICAAKTGFASTESAQAWFRGFRSRESERHGTRPELYTCNVVLEAE